MEVKELLLDFIRGKHTAGQMLNLLKYFCGKKKEVVSWEPIYIAVFPTFKCNFTCDMCSTHSRRFTNPYGQKPSADIAFRDFKQIVDLYHNAMFLNLIGNGESLLNKDFFEMVEYASKVRKMYVYSSSNGFIVGDYIEKILKSSLTEFNVSLNGHNRKEFNRMTGMPEEYFDIICKNITELVHRRNSRRSNVKITMSIVLDQQNIAYLSDMVYFADSLGTDNVFFYQFCPSPAAGFTAAERCLFTDDSSVLKAFAGVRSLPPGIRNKISLPPLLQRNPDGNRLCSVPFFSISIDGNLDVGACSCQILDFSDNGKYFEGDAWNNDRIREFRRRFLDPGLAILEPCQWCYNNQQHTRLFANPNPVFFLIRRLFHRLPGRSEK